MPLGFVFEIANGGVVSFEAVRCDRRTSRGSLDQDGIRYGGLQLSSPPVAMGVEYETVERLGHR